MSTLHNSADMSDMNGWSQIGCIGNKWKIGNIDESSDYRRFWHGKLAKNPSVLCSVSRSIVEGATARPHRDLPRRVRGNGHVVHRHGICHWGRLRASNTGGKPPEASHDRSMCTKKRQARKTEGVRFTEAVIMRVQNSAQVSGLFQMKVSTPLRLGLKVDESGNNGEVAGWFLKNCFWHINCCLSLSFLWAPRSSSISLSDFCGASGPKHRFHSSRLEVGHLWEGARTFRRKNPDVSSNFNVLWVQSCRCQGLCASE